VLWLKRERGTSLVGSASSVLAEKALDLVFLSLVGLWWLLFTLAPPEGVSPVSAIALGLITLALLGLFAWIGSPVLRWLESRLGRGHSRLGKWLAARVGAISAGLAGLSDQHRLAGSIGLSACIWGVMVCTDWLLLGAFDLPLELRLAVSVVLWGHIGVAARLTPANIGPHHWAITFGLTLAGVARGTAFAYAVVLHAMVTLLPLLITIVLHGWKLPSIPERGAMKEGIPLP
jgi:hypothetical protein